MEIGAWLRGLGLGRYEQLFRDNDVDAELLPRLSAKDLQEIGVASFGHRRRLLDAIASLRGEAGPTRAGADLAWRAVQPLPGRAERRQLTVMFVDLVGSTALAACLDPEDMREVLRAYQGVVAGAVARYGGQIAKFLGDGVLVHFGWPVAHEDDAERAVRTGLMIVEAVPKLSTPADEPIAARVGIATGLTLVGELIGEGPSREETVVGETPNLAARLQAIAAPGAVVIAGVTRRLVGALFELEDLGPQVLKGVAKPLPAFAVRGERPADSRFEARQGGDAPGPMIGRERELSSLLGHWRRAVAGEGRAVLLVGEAGIGKSRLARALADTVSGEPHMEVCYQCSPLRTDSPLWPVARQLARAAGLMPSDEPGERLGKLEALLGQAGNEARSAASLIADLLGIEIGGYGLPPDLSAQERRAQTLKALAAQLSALAARQPLLLLLEDMHWVDPTTRELVDMVLDRIAPRRVLLILTSRPEEAPAPSWRPEVARLHLQRLDAPEALAFVDHVAREATVPPEIKARVVASADGVPLFVEELTKAFLEAGAPAERRDGGILVEGTATLAIPLTLEGSLVARLDRQAAAAKEVAQLGACVGREFSFGLLAATKLLASGRMIEEAFERLVASGLVLRRGEGAETIYGFKHALVRDAAYGTLPKSKRRALHARIARTLEEVSPETVRAEPELLAFHYTEAAMTHEAVGHWRKAGEAALARSAHAEAVARLGKALTLLAGLPEDDDRRRRELKLQLALGRALIAARGEAASETGQAYARARQLCAEVGDSPHALPVLYGRYIYRFGRGELRRARELAKEYLDRAKHVGNVPAQATGHRMLGITSLHLGRLHKARAHLERALATSSAAPTRSPDVFYPYDPRVVCLARLSDALLLLGYPDQALARCRAALAEAQALAHPETLGIALASSIGLHQDLRDAETVEEQAQALVALGAERGIAYFRQEGMLALGWVLAERAKPDEGLETMRPVLAAFRADEKALGMTYRLLTVAGVCGKARRAAEGLDLLADAFDLAQRTGEHWFEAEQHRVKGELLLSAPAPDEAAAEVCFREALAVASRQGARMWELRAATSLARLRRTQERHAEALDLLAPAHAWFTEGFEARDLVEAGALLESSRCSLAGCDPGGRS